MPKLSDFSQFASQYHREVLAAGSTATATALRFGADHMRKFILADSPTGTPWHEMKNAENGYQSGSRIGNTEPFKWKNYESDVHFDAGHMLRSVGSTKAAVSGQLDQIVGFFGWIDSENNPYDNYFIAQDTGGYGVGARVGMGLLNPAANGGKKVLQKLGAAYAASGRLQDAAKSAGFKVKGTSDWK